MKRQFKIRDFYYNHLIKFILIISACFSAYAADFYTDPFHTTSRLISNPRSAGLSNAGCAIPDGAGSTMLNPSLIHSWHKMNDTKYAAQVSFHKESLFSKYAINLGASWKVNKKASISSIYRYLKKDNNYKHNETIISASGQLFDKNGTQGGVDVGVNLRYDNIEWWRTAKEYLPIAITSKDTINDTTIFYPNTVHPNYNITDRRIIFDFGFFQSNIAKNLDFGLTFHNLFGYSWHSISPVEKHSVNTDSTNPLDDETIVIDSTYYSPETSKTNRWLNKQYRRMTVGIVYHLPLMQNKLMVNIPFDLEFFGLFDKKKKNTKISMHTGAEACWNEIINFRFGYAYAPEHILRSSGKVIIKNEHILSGGFGVKFKRISFDMFIRGEYNWGIGSTLAF